VLSAEPQRATAGRSLPAQRVPGRRSGRVAGAVGENRSRTYGEALATGPANRALRPVSGRCVGENHYRGAERSGGFRGVAPPG